MNLRSLNSAQVKVHCMHLRYHWFLARSKLHSISSRLLGLTRSNSIPSISGHWSPQSSQYSRQKLLFELHNSQCENSNPLIRSLWFLHVMNFGVTPTPNPKIYMWFCRVWFFLTLSFGECEFYCLNIPDSSMWSWKASEFGQWCSACLFLRWPNVRVVLGGQMLFKGLEVTPLQNGFRTNKLQQNLSWPKLNDLKCMDWNVTFWTGSQFLPPPPPKKLLQTTTSKLSTDIRNENHQIPPEHPLENSNKGLPTPAWELGNPSFTNHSSEGPPHIILEDRSLLKTSALALAPPPSQRSCTTNPPLENSGPGPLGVRQRSGEGVVRRNGRPKGCFGESVSSLLT